MSKRRRGLAVALLLGAHMLAGEGDARAQPSPETRAAAVALFDDARALMARDRFAEACPKLEESQRIDPGIGTRYNLAVCHEHLGRTASAWVGFREVASLALAAGQSEREKQARARATALAPKLIRLKVVIGADATDEGLSVKRDGAVMSPALFGTAVPLDPGEHVISASAAGKEPWERVIALKEPGTTATVEVPPLLARKAGATPSPLEPDPGLPARALGASPPPGPLDPGRPAHRSVQLPLGIALTVGGALGLGAGTAVGLLAKSKFDASNEENHCDMQDQCDPTGLKLRGSAVGLANLGTGLFIAGAGLTVAGVILWITAPSSAPKASSSAPKALSSAPTPAARRPLRLGVGPGGVMAAGVF